MSAATMISRRRWVVGGMAAAALAPLAWWVGMRPLGAGRDGLGLGQGGARVAAGAPLVGHEAPSFTLADPDGKQVSLQKLRGKPVVLNFWATWCVPCREEMPELEAVYRQHQHEGLVVLAVSIDDERSAKDVPAYLKQGSPSMGSYTFPVALDVKQEVVRTYKLLGVPGSFFLDPGGVIRALHAGAMDHQMIQDALRTILPGS